MTELRDVIAGNICALRTEACMTQLALAEKLNYSDKAVSKWERAESVPDIFMLKRIADLFGVTVDYLLESDHSATEESRKASRRAKAKNRAIISFLAVGLVWLIATALFVLELIFFPSVALPAWLYFIYAIPVCSIVALVFNSLWGKRKLNYLVISILVWSMILSVFLSVLTVGGLNVWQVFIIGIPAQVIICLWSGLSGKAKNNLSRR